MNAESDTKRMGLALSLATRDMINSILSHLTYLYVIFSNTFASFIGIFQYSLIVMSRVDFFPHQTLLMSYVVE